MNLGTHEKHEELRTFEDCESNNMLDIFAVPNILGSLGFLGNLGTLEPWELWNPRNPGEPSATRGSLEPSRTLRSPGTLWHIELFAPWI